MSGLDEKRMALLEHSLVIRKLRLIDVPKAVRVVDAAMQNDPTLHYLRDTSDAKADYWQKQWRVIMAIGCTNSVRKGEAWTIGDTFACIVYQPPSQTEDVLDKFISGILKLLSRTVTPRLFSEQQMRRSAEWKTKSTEAMEVALGSRKESMWYLAELMTHPEHQGHGYGTALVNFFIQQADLHGHASWLWSSNVANETFYNSFGFITRAEVLLGSEDPDWHEPPVVSQLMVREYLGSV